MIEEKRKENDGEGKKRDGATRRKRKKKWRLYGKSGPESRGSQVTWR